MRLLRENIAQEKEGEADFDKSMDSTSVDDDKTFAAMGVAKTIGTVCGFYEASAFWRVLTGSRLSHL